MDRQIEISYVSCIYSIQRLCSEGSKALVERLQNQACNKWCPATAHLVSNESKNQISQPNSQPNCGV